MSNVKFIDKRAARSPKMLSTGGIVEIADGLFMKTSYGMIEGEHLACLVSYNGRHVRGVRYPITNSEFKNLTPIDITITVEDENAVDM